jgi:hypothetical protein
MTQTMTIAAILLCTTLVTNVGNTSVVTRDCREVAPPIVMKAPTESKTIALIQPAAATINDLKFERWSNKAETQVQAARSVSLQAMLPAEDAIAPTVAPEPAIAKPANTKRVRAAKYSQNRKLRKVSRRAVEIREANRMQRPAVQYRDPRKLTPWERLKGIMISRPDLAPTT